MSPASAKKRTKPANHKSYHKKAMEIFMVQFRNKPCEVCGNIKGSVGHHIIPQGRSRSLKFDSRNIIVLCPSHHKFSNDMAPHSSNQMAVDRFNQWMKEHKSEQWEWCVEHEKESRKYTYKQALENLQNGREAWA